MELYFQFLYYVYLKFSSNIVDRYIPSKCSEAESEHYIHYFNVFIYLFLLQIIHKFGFCFKLRSKLWWPWTDQEQTDLLPNRHSSNTPAHTRTHATLIPLPGLVDDAGKPPRDMPAGINTRSRPLLTQPWFMRENVSSRPADYLQDRSQFLFIYCATGIFSFYETIQ